MFFIVKTIVSALVIAVISEISKKHVGIGGFLSAMPITTLLVIFWLYYEQKDLNILADFVKSVLLAIPVSFLFFIPLIYMFKRGFNFYLTILIGILFLAVGAFFYNKAVNFR